MNDVCSEKAMLIRSQILIVLKCVNRVSLIFIYSLTPLHTRMEGELERVTLNRFFLLLTFQAFIWEIHMEAASVQLSFPQHIFWFFNVSYWISDLWTQLCIPATEVIQGPHMATVPVRPPCWNPTLRTPLLSCVWQRYSSSRAWHSGFVTLF